jgi:hypothetical protein
MCEVKEKAAKLTGQHVPKENLNKEKEEDAKNMLVKDRETQYYCSKCFKFLCLEHGNIHCSERLNGNDFHL